MGKFFGTYNRTLDTKNRLQIPSKLLNELPKNFFMLRGFEGCISLYLENDFNNLVNKLSSLNFLEENNRAYIRLTLSSVNELEVDSHGRISLSKQLIETYKIQKDVIIIGLIDHFEIWDKETYLTYEKKQSSHYEDIAENIGKKEE